MDSLVYVGIALIILATIWLWVQSIHQGKSITKIEDKVNNLEEVYKIKR